MPYKPSRTLVEKLAIRLGIVPDLDGPDATKCVTSTGQLSRFPDEQEWDDFVEYDPQEYPRRAVARHYRLVPTTCFNCESACGLLAYVDKESGQIRKFEGNPIHPGSRGKNCAKGPASINQVRDPDRILTPLKRVGARGEGKWKEVSWDEALADIGGRIRKALQENRRDEVVYHVGRPGSEGSVDRVLRAWGVDGHNSHTNICSAGARFGYAIWSGYDRPSPDYANARFILALNAHLESGHYFNPHAQRISEGMKRGAKMAVVDPRLSNTASMSSYWLPTRPGTEAALLLAMANVLLEEGLYDRVFIERWTNWRQTLEALSYQSQSKPEGQTIDDFIAALKKHYAQYTPEFAEKECGVSKDLIITVAREIGAAGTKFCSHTWRGAASAHEGGWQVSRCLFLLHVLTGSVGTEGGCLPSAWNKYKANLINVPPPQNHWNELHWPKEFPFAHYEMSQLLPHFLKTGRGKIDTYFTRVFNPVWTYPDGFSWIEALRDESKIGCHIALTPTWNETAFYADYVLPMGLGSERHDLNTYETHSGTWIAFRQPVLRAVAMKEGKTVRDTRDVNPGQVWEEDEFWIALSWAIDPDGSMGIRKYFESPSKPGEKLTVDDYYGYAFDRVPGLPEKAKEQNLTPLEYMRKVGAYEVKRKTYERYERVLSDDELAGAETDPATGVVRKNGHAIGIKLLVRCAPGQSASTESKVVEGFPTPSRLLEFFSPTMAEWGWAEHALPGYIRSHVYEEEFNSAPDQKKSESQDAFVLLNTFRLPTLIHTRSGSTKWLNEISQRNPIWIHTSDAKRFNLSTGDLVRVNTDIGYFVDRCWVTEAIRPGVIACSHHLGRWRRRTDPPNSRWSGNTVAVEELGQGQWRMRTTEGPVPFESNDPDTKRLWWREGGVPQNLTFPVHPDPISGMHCWHQRVTIAKASRGDQCGDVFVDTTKSMQVYENWMKKTHWPAGPGNLRRPLWLNRPLKPTEEAYRL
ncbi:MAG TPA: molybdopterin-dependent oxidoreductase [Tepidisphaeraceae bacterium]|nr:molybdopterin-dependent oxidoreductase [Tepidisphaeraceae bacterium]